MTFSFKNGEWRPLLITGASKSYVTYIQVDEHKGYFKSPRERIKKKKSSVVLETD